MNKTHQVFSFQMPLLAWQVLAEGLCSSRSEKICMDDLEATVPLKVKKTCKFTAQKKNGASFDF